MRNEVLNHTPIKIEDIFFNFLSAIGFNVFPSLTNIFAALGITLGLFVCIKLIRVIYYELKYGDGAGEFYLSHGKKATIEEYSNELQR